MAIGFHVCGSKHITKPNKNEKKIQCPPIKSPPFFKVMIFSPKVKVYYAFITQQVQRNTFFEWIFNQRF
jgi:hypothetical protein